MKKIILLILAGISLLAAGCASNAYSNQRRKEDKLIANYISRKQINILKTLPPDNYEWKEKDYYASPGVDDLYFHLIERGDTAGYEVVANDVIVARYTKFALTEDADTLSYWTTLEQAYPMEFHLDNITECEAEGWHRAIRLMKYSDSMCELIVPSKQGFVEDQTSVTPYVYILKIKIKQ
jgi:hypothetical protein